MSSKHTPAVAYAPGPAPAELARICEEAFQNGGARGQTRAAARYPQLRNASRLLSRTIAACEPDEIALWRGMDRASKRYVWRILNVGAAAGAQQ